MRLAFISDIHAILPAMGAAVERRERRPVVEATGIGIRKDAQSRIA